MILLGVGWPVLAKDKIAYTVVFGIPVFVVNHLFGGKKSA
jgi:hypothetical protein